MGITPGSDFLSMRLVQILFLFTVPRSGGDESGLSVDVLYCFGFLFPVRSGVVVVSALRDAEHAGPDLLVLDIKVSCGLDDVVEG